MIVNLERRLTKLESKAPGSAQPVTLIVLAGALPTVAEQHRIDTAEALDHFVIAVHLIGANHAEDMEDAIYGPDTTTENGECDSQQTFDETRRA